MISRVAFLGLGAMGRPMAANLARAGFAVTGWNRTARSFADLEALGVAVAPAIRDAVTGCQAVCMCVLDDPAAEAVLAEALPFLPRGTLVLDHSTLGAATSRRLAAMAAAQGVRYLDAPVSGGTAGAAAGSLTILAGGDPAAFAEARPVLDTLGPLVRHMGPAGSGHAAKLINQLLTSVHQAAAVEALALGRRLGLEPAVLHEVLSASYGASRMLDRTVPVVQSGDFASAFTVDVLIKDLKLVAGLGREAASAVPLAALALELFERARTQGLGSLDAGALIQMYERS